jgi:ABC-2 type transport system ATP-binding protein
MASGRAPGADLLVAMTSFTYRYPEARAPALRELDLAIDEGEFVVLAGRSGSGKSSLLRACCGLIPHYHGGEVAGSLTVCGRDVREHGPAELGGLVGLVGQDPEAQVVSATVRGELELPLELRGEPPAARARALEEVALALAIPHLTERATDTLSGGELQRVALAAAMVHGPELLLLDEPTAGVDPKARREFWDEIHRLTEGGMTVLVSTHYMDEAERCHRINYIAYGRLIAEGTVEEVVARAGLSTRHVSGPGLEAVARRLRAAPGVDQVAAFGTSLHVVGRDAAALDAALAAVAGGGVTVGPAETSLEDVFIQFMGASEDNMA